MRQMVYKGGTPLHILTLLIMHKTKRISGIEMVDTMDNLEYNLSQAYVTGKIKTYMHNFHFPGSLMSALHILSEYPIKGLKLPNKGDVNSQMFLARSNRNLPIIPVMTLLRELEGDKIRWIISFNTKKVHDPRCYFLAKCRNKKESLIQLERTYNKLREHEVPWQTIWECLSDMIRGSGI